MITMAIKVTGQGAPTGLAWVITNKTAIIAIMLKIVVLIRLIYPLYYFPYLIVLFRNHAA